MPTRPSIGLYFNDNFVEVSQVSADGLRLEKFNQMMLPVGLVVNSEIKNPINFSQIVQELFATAKPKGISTNSEVVIGINDNRVFLRELEVPNIPGKNINDAIEYQVRTLLPVLPSGVETDWEIIGKSTEGQIEVLVAATPRSLIESYVSAISTVGLRIVGVEPVVFANIRIINAQQIQNINFLMVYLGDNFCVFSYVTSGNPRFSDLVPQNEVSSNEDISKKILTYINFANSKHPGRQIQEILITGYRNDLDEVIDELKKKNISATKAVSRLTKGPLLNHSLLHTSHGLSLKTLDQQLLNLLPVEFRLDVIRGRLSYTWKLVMVLLIVFSLFILGGLAYLFRTSESERLILSELKAQQEIILNDQSSKVIIKRADDLNKITGQLTLLRNVTGGEENLLKVLSANTPNGVVLSSLIIARGPTSTKLSDAGSSWILTGTATSRPLVLDFYERLIATDEFEGGKLYFGSLEKDIGLTFRIAGQPPK